MKRWIAVVVLAVSVYAWGEETMIPCQWENPKDRKQQAYLNEIWKEAQKAAGLKAKKPRPRICGREGAWPMILDGIPGVLCGYYDPVRNDALVMDDPECGPVRCVLIHEYLHAIMGSGHKGHSEVMERAGCAEEPSE